jgi:hypothetical protein
MTDNGRKAPLPFQAPADTPIVGQPFTLANLSIPLNGQLICHCSGAGEPLLFVSSAPVRCPRCARVYTVLFNPATGQINVLTAAEQVPS